jgi:16S rRNA (adenine(1408)-N(1))-methyltransferase
MKVMSGKETVEITSEELFSRMGNRTKVMLDIGTGDGKFVYKFALLHPDWFCIGLDASSENLVEYSLKIGKKPSRGGVDNVLYVIANAESIPGELHNLASLICVNYPWGSLLRGIVLANINLLENIANAAVRGAEVEILTNNNIFADPVPLGVADLPEVTESYIEQVLKPVYSRVGLEIVSYELIGKAEMKRIPTSWSGRLAFGKNPNTMKININYTE